MEKLGLELSELVWWEWGVLWAACWVCGWIAVQLISNSLRRLGWKV